MFRGSQTCYEDASDMSRWSGVSLTCPQQVHVRFVGFGERHDTRAALPQLQTAGRSCYEKVANIP